MRPLVLVALLASSVALAAADVPVAQQKQQLAAMARQAAEGLEEQANYVALLQPMPERKLHISELEPFVLWGTGWSAPTENGIWSLDKQSSLYIRLEEGERPSRLLIQGSYFNGPEPTRLFVNGQLIIEAPLVGQTVDILQSLDGATAMHIELHHLNPVSPRDIKPNSRDTRKIKFKLEQIRVW